MNVLDALALDVLYAPEQDMWVRLQADGTAYIGATHLVALHGQFMLFTPRPPGTEVARDRSLGVMETAKTAVAIHAPLSSRILESNAAALNDVQVVTTDPYGLGWLFRVRPTALEDERHTLVDAATYRAWIEPRLKERLAPPIDEAGQDDAYIDPHCGY